MRKVEKEKMAGEPGVPEPPALRGWTEEKLRFEPDRFRSCIEWLRTHELIPDGKAKKVE